MIGGKHKIMQEVIVGLVVIAGIFLLAAAILVLGQESRIFSQKMTYRTVFPDATGLRVGSPVTMSGVRVGTVSKLFLPTDPEGTGIEIFVAVDEAYAERVRQDTEATPVIMQLVANEKAIELSPGSPDERALRQGELIPPKIPASIFERGGNIADGFEELTAELRTILISINRGEGLLGKAINDPEFGEDGLTQARDALYQAKRMLARINRGEGLAGRLLADEDYALRIAEDLERMSEGFARVAERLGGGEGSLGKMLGPESDALFADLESTAASLKTVSTAVAEGRGLSGLLLSDSERAERIARNLDETLARTASITRKIDEGEGTLGLLVNDRGVHDDAQKLMRGVRESRIASWLLRKFYENGEEAQEEDALADEAQGVSSLTRPEQAGPAAVGEAYYPPDAPGPKAAPSEPAR
jgi:phospholipid/cholesterol/gamma-HCH transport system substrate-binding protein